MANMKKRDFDYYLTNLDWDDGTEIDREITQFTRNDVFEHNYEKPGFYSIKGLIFKYNEIGIEALGEDSPTHNMSDVWQNNNDNTYADGWPNSGDTYHFVETIDPVTELSSSMSTIKKRPQQGGNYDAWVNQKYTISEMYKSYTPIFVASMTWTDNPFNTEFSDYNSTYVDTVVAIIENRNSDSLDGSGRKPGISIAIPIQMDVSRIDFINYSFEINLPNPNHREAVDPSVIDNTDFDQNLIKESNYVIRERLYPPNASNTVDWGGFYQDHRIVQGVGGSSRDENREYLPNQGWQRIQGTLFSQERPTYDSDGAQLPDTIDHDITYIRIEIFPNTYGDTPQGMRNPDLDVNHEDNKEFIAIRNISFKTPNTENIIRPVEWQRFHSNIVVNPRDDYDSPLYEENDFAMIGGLSENSSHFKTLASMLAYDIEAKKYKSSVKPDYNEYDLLAMYDTLAKYDAELYNFYLEPYVKQINEDYAPYFNRVGEPENIYDDKFIISSSLYNKPVITTGMFDKSFHGVFKNTYITDVDIATTKMFKGVKPMWKQLGFDNFEFDNPSLNGYWKNIIPKDYTLKDREGISVQEYQGHYFQKGSLTPRIPYRNEYIIDETSDQNWLDGSYWPVLPKLNRVGIFEDEVNTKLYGDETIDSITKFADSDTDLVFNLNFNVDEVGELEDTVELNNIRYSVDSVLGLDNNNRLIKEDEDIPDVIEKDINGQAF